MRTPLSVPIRTAAPVLSVLLHAAVLALLQFDLAAARPEATPEPIPLEIVKDAEAPKKEPEPLKAPEPIPPAPKAPDASAPPPMPAAPAPTPPATPSPERRGAALPPPSLAEPAPESPALPEPRTALPLPPATPSPERRWAALPPPSLAAPAPKFPTLLEPRTVPPLPSSPEREIAKREKAPHAGTEVDDDAAPDLKDKTKVLQRWELDPLKLNTGHRCGAARLTAMLHITEERGGVYHGLLSRRIVWAKCKPETALYSIELRLAGAAAVLVGQGFRDEGRYENGVLYLTDAYGSSIWRRK